MATYKVPQDVEADDKLIGPFSFRQFIYLIIVALAIALAWGLAQLFVGLAIIPLPIIIFFGALALPLRKDQPMEIYLAAIVSFYLKPHRRLWDPEGIESLIEITAPKTVEVQRAKDLSQTEAAQRLSYLANIVDSQGWAIRGVSGAAGTAMNNDVFLEAQSITDVLDTNTSVAQSFDQMMTQSTERMREEARQRMFQATVAPAVPAVSTTPATPLTAPTDAGQVAPEFNPYPTFHQSVIQPLNDVAHQAKSDIEAPEDPATVTPIAPAAAPVNSAPSTETARGASPHPASAYAPEVPHETQEKAATTSGSPLSAGIMNLANNPDLSIETIAHEAHRLKKKAEEESDEVVISLR